MTRYMVVAILVLAALSGAAMANDYWPTSGYSTYLYRDDSGRDMVVTMNHGQRETVTADYRQMEIYEVDASGNLSISLSEAVGLAPGNLRFPYTLTYSPPLGFLAALLPIGQTGNSSTTATEVYGGLAFSVDCSWVVMGEETVQVPAGTFHIIVVEVTTTALIESGIYHLSPGIGPVVLPRGYRLVSVNGTVPASQTSWGALKSLFR